MEYYVFTDRNDTPRYMEVHDRGDDILAVEITPYRHRDSENRDSPSEIYRVSCGSLVPFYVQGPEYVLRQLYRNGARMDRCKFKSLGVGFADKLEAYRHWRGNLYAGAKTRRESITDLRNIDNDMFRSLLI